MRFKFGLGKEAFATVVTKQLKVSSMSSHVGQQIAAIPKPFLTLGAWKLAIVRYAGSSTTSQTCPLIKTTHGWSRSIAYSIAGIIDDIQGVCPAQETGCFNRSVKAGVTSICACHHRLRGEIGQIV